MLGGKKQPVTGHDPTLLGVAAELGLRFPESSEAWWQQIREEVPDLLRTKFRSQRRRRDAGRLGDGPFYRLLADPVLARPMLEGRLGYYNAVLPALADVVARLPHGRICDLGCFGGILTFCLARLFPDAQVVGVDRLGAWVTRSREFLDRLQLPNVTFVHCDFRAFVPKEQFDILVSISALPTAQLPAVLAECPRSHRRGRQVADMANQQARGIRHMASCLSTLPYLLKPQGRLIVHERACDPGQGLLFLFLACQARFAVTNSIPVSWTTAAEQGGPWRAPLVTLERRSNPVEYDEEQLLPLFLDPPARMPSGGLPPFSCEPVFGSEAEGMYANLPNPRTTVRCEQHDPNGQWWEIEFGTAGNAVNYRYICNVADYRELRLCDLPALRKLIDESLKYLAGLGYSFSVRPDPEKLKDLLAAVFN
jgi:SAM-dependent methyltransferase